MTGRLLPLLAVVPLCGAAVAGWLRVNQRAVRRRRGSLLLPGGPPTRHRPWARGRGRPGWLAPELVLLPCGLLAGWQQHSPLPAVAGALAIVPARRWRCGRRAGRLERDRAAAVVELCAAVAGELRSGATPEQALETVVGPGGDVARRLGSEAAARLTAAARYGADVPAALRWLATLPGGGGANAVSACWQVATGSGTGLAPALDQVAEALRADRVLREEIRGELTGPRTTALLLAALPAFGLVLGSALGASPLRILLHTPVGLLCLAGGALLETAGLLWTGRIVRQAMADLGLRAGTGSRPGQQVPLRPARRSGSRGARPGERVRRPGPPGPGRGLARRRAGSGFDRRVRGTGPRRRSAWGCAIGAAS
ncbi:type II secretion system F family protein [Kitasatospora sp. NPDC006697]|uniref:type II secretion system F family protein n=1 Tax=Kitasatospora sp. NPDC006697 TaxID=3364020 RepID=UPI0036C6F268